MYGPGPHYFFKIGNKANFEQKLEEAQQQLGISREEFIPVEYKNGSNIGQTGLLLLAAGLGLSAFMLIRGINRQQAAAKGKNQGKV